MGRKGKNMAGGAASGAAAGSAAGPWGAVIGGAVGAIAGSQMPDEAQQLKPAMSEEMVTRLYNQASGLTPTVGELKGAQMYDKTLAQQIAAAKAQRGVNAGLLSRNVNRIAAEQSQANAQNAAILAAEERNQAMTKYMQAQALNSNIAAQNLGFERAADQQANNMLGAGLNSAASALVQGAQRKDAESQLSEQKADKDLKATSEKSQDIAKSFSMGAVDPYAPQNNPAFGQSSYLRTSDKNAKTNIKSESLKVTSDERQKDLISNENLPANNNLQMQTQQAVQPAAAPSAPVAQPAQATPQASAPQAAPAAPAPMQGGITAEMLQAAQRSSKKGGNVSDIQNAVNTAQDGVQGPSQDEINRMFIDAKNRETRGMFGEVTQSEHDNYAANLQRWHDANNAKRAEYQKQQGLTDEQNLINDATRTARLNRFYTGIDTGSTGAIASQYVPKQVLANVDFGAAQQVYRNTPQPRNLEAEAFLARQLERDRGPVRGGAGSGSMYRTSDEDQKTEKKAGGASDFNPKSFLDKLQAYSYEYKKSAEGLPGVTPGRHLGVMAQSLEKAGPVGESMVKEDESGNKVVDYGSGFSAILASQAHLNERLSKIESKKKKV